MLWGEVQQFADRVKIGSYPGLVGAFVCASFPMQKQRLNNLLFLTAVWSGMISSA
jgi:hypothetical protein